MIRPKKNVDNAVVVIGVCAMAKKSQSTPMKEILRRLDEYFDKFKILIFPESVILNDPVNTWPLCDCLISFHSKGFPLNKAIEYQKLRKPYVVNDLNRQFELLDRGKVYTVLKQHNIETPRYGLYNSKLKSTELIEDDDQITLDGQTFNKPFVEKPLSAEDHNINIYFQSSVGGGSVRLFRKINNRSSIYCPDSKIRREGSYIYEDYLPTDGIDVKVYAVGPSYAHAEARKSPGLDGKVERDSNGKEIRYPIILSNEEKLIARKVVLAFKQTVCGFDFLRSDDKSYVCDVNGFSFVKTSKKYYDDTARILGDIIMHNCAGPLSIPYKPSYQPDDPPLVSTTYGKMMELRCVLGVIRHGDRTPKQKMKMEVRHKKWFDLYYKYALNSSKKAPKTPKMVDLKLKRPNQLQEVLDITRDLLRELENASPRSVDERASSPELDGNRQKLETLKMVLEMYGHFSGINRKVQLKYQPRGRQRSRTSDTDIETLRVPSLLLILKWGGELTPAGRIQAEELGKAFRCLYPGGQGNYGGDSRGLGFLRLHSTFRHDLKIYASDEGRVQMTAAAFAKGLLALEGELTPILVQMVKSADTNGLLDDDYDARNCQAIVKKYLHGYLQQDKYVDSFDMKQLDPMGTRSIQNALTCIENPRKNCDRIYDLVFKLVGSIRAKVAAEGSGIFLYLDETLLLALRRWEKLLRDFRRCRRKTGNVQYDISKIPDIYDCVKYDLEHNSRVIVFDQIEDLYICSKYMADIVVPQEYGITVQQKLKIAAGICTPLMRKLKRDLKHCVENANMTSSLMGSVSNSLKHSLSPSVSATPIAPIKPTKEITDNKTETSEVSSRTEPENVTRLDPRAVQGIATPFRHVRTRLYFTSESHIHSMMNLLRNADLIDNPISDEQWQRALNFLSSVTEFNYMAQLVLMLYEDTTKDESSDQRFHVELHFSPGALPCIQTTHVAGLGYRPKSRETEVLTNTSRTLSTSTNKTDSLQNDSTHSTMPAEPVNQPNSGPVNIVAVNNGPDPPITSAELALHSPVSGSPQSSTRGILQHSVSVAADSFAQNHASKQTEVNSITLDSNKSSSSSSAILVRSTSESHFVKSRNSEAMNYNSCLVTVNENVVDSSRTKVKYNTPAVKHHTTNLKLLKHGENKLISTDVIKGYTHVKEDKMPPPDPTVLSTAVITRGASAPDLKIFDEPCHQDQDSDIKYFVPPLRSLETLHNQLDWRQMDSFLSKITHLTGISPMSSSSLRSTSNLEEENKVSTKGKTCASSRSPLDNGKTRSKSKEGSDSKCPITEANIITVNKPRKARDDLTIEYGGGKDRSTKSKSPSENTQRSIIADIVGNAPTTPPFVHDPERAYQNKFNKRWSRKYSIPEKQKCILLAEERSSSEINKKEKSKHKKDRSRSKKKNDTKTKEKDKSKKNKTS